MNKNTYSLGALTLILVLGALPITSLADNRIFSVEQRITNLRLNGQTQNNVEASTTIRVNTENEQHESEQATSSRENETEQKNATSTDAREQNEERFQFKLENSTSSVHSFEELKRDIDQRRSELDREEKDAASEDRDILKRINPVRLAVHTLLDSKDLMGGIGEQVSQVAREMNDSAATTTAAEVKIESRGFLTRFFFGGDQDSANAILQEVTQNQTRIARLTELLNQANLSVDIRTALEVQVTALRDSQTRLLSLVQKEQNSWGILSWRFTQNK